jgi:hypothetical protein
MFVLFLTDKDAGRGDFLEYWAAGQQLTHGASPYDPAGIMRLERAVGREGNQPKFTFSPPVVLLLALPLGFVTPKVGLILWLLILHASLFTSIWILWILHGRPDSALHWCSYLFPPALACLMAGQLGIFLLLGVVLFLYFHGSRPFVAGAALLPCILKPHLFLPISIVLLLWVASRKAYRVLGGFFALLLASSALTLCFQGPVWSQYFEMMRATGVLHEFVPTLSVAFRYLIDRNAVWLEFVPVAGGCVWAVWYFLTRRTRWSWMDEGLLVLLVSAACAPYSLFSDEAILLPAVLAGVYRAAQSRRSLLPIAFICGIALVELYTVGRMSSPFYLWTVPAWLGWYLYSTWSTGEHTEPIPSNAEVAAD